VRIMKRGSARIATAAVHGTPKPPANGIAAATAATAWANETFTGAHGPTAMAIAREALPAAVSISLKSNPVLAAVVVVANGTGVDRAVVVGVARMLVF